MKSRSVNGIELYVWIQTFLIWLKVLGVIDWTWHAVMFPTYFLCLEIVAAVIIVIIKYFAHSGKTGANDGETV